jgi:hypothetical protein
MNQLAQLFPTGGQDDPEQREPLGSLWLRTLRQRCLTQGHMTREQGAMNLTSVRQPSPELLTFFFGGGLGLGFEVRALCLQSRHSTA